MWIIVAICLWVSSPIPTGNVRTIHLSPKWYILCSLNQRSIPPTHTYSIYVHMDILHLLRLMAHSVAAQARFIFRYGINTPASLLLLVQSVHDNRGHGKHGCMWSRLRHPTYLLQPPKTQAMCWQCNNLQVGRPNSTCEIEDERSQWWIFIAETYSVLRAHANIQFLWSHKNCAESVTHAIEATPRDMKRLRYAMTPNEDEGTKIDMKTKTEI